MRSRIILSMVLGASLAGCSVNKPEAFTDSSGFQTDQNDTWIQERPNGDLGKWWRGRIQDETWYEVVPPKLTRAIQLLAERPIRALSQVEAQSFAGKHYRCPEGLTPYLVRAIYGQGATGGYSLSRFEGELLVQHSSLGSPVYHRAALVVNLPSEPQRLFIEVGFAL
jgi:hypothetical protein